MTNREKFGEMMLDMTIMRGVFGVKDGKPCFCDKTECSECDFEEKYHCTTNFQNWLNEEYIEPPVDWSQVPIDTPILVRDHEENIWVKRHFAGVENEVVFLWNKGKTSWTAEGDKVPWKYAKLATPEDLEG